MVLAFLSRLDPRRSLRARLGATFGGLALLVAASAGMIEGYRQEAVLRSHITTSFENLAGAFEAGLSRSISDRHDELRALARALQAEGRKFLTEPPATGRAFLQAIRSDHPEFAWIGLADASGRVRTATDTRTEDEDVSQRSWFRGAMAAPALAGGDPMALQRYLAPSASDASRFIDIAYPIVDAQAQVRGVVGAQLSLAWAVDLLSELRARVAGAESVEVELLPESAVSGTGVQAGPPHDAARAWAIPLTQVSGATVTRGDGAERVVGFHRLGGPGAYRGQGWVVVVGKPSSVAFAAAAQARWRVVVVALFLGFMFGIAGWWLAARIARPLERITEEAEGARHGGDFAFPAPADADEIGTLAVVLSHLVTELRDREERLRRSTAELESIIETIAEGLMLIDGDGNIVRINAAAERILGAQREEVVGRHHTNVPWRRLNAAGAPMPVEESPFEQLRKGGVGLRQLEFEFERPDGRRTWVSLNTVALRDRGGNFAGSLGTFADITASKHAQQQARDAQERLDCALDAWSLSLFEVDVASGAAFLSEGWSVTRGGPPVATRIDAKALFELTHPDEREMLRRAVIDTLKGNRPRYDIEHRVRTIGGDWVWLLSSFRVVERDATGWALRVAGSNLDITERKRAAEALATHAMHESILSDFGRYALQTRDLDALMKEAAQRVWSGLDAEFCMLLERIAGGESVRERACMGRPVPPREALRPLAAEPSARLCIQSRQAVVVEDYRQEARFAVSSLDAASGVMSGIDVPIEGSGAVFGVLGVRWKTARRFAVDDVHFVQAMANVIAAAVERQETERRLAQAEKLEAMGRLAGGIAHDFNNILGAILGYADMMESRAARGSRMRKYAGNVAVAAERGKDVVAQIVAFSRERATERGWVNVSQVVEEVVAVLAGSMPANIRVVRSLPGRPMSTFGEAAGLYQLFLNLCTNAVQAMPRGGELRITVREVFNEEPRVMQGGTLERGRFVAVEVADQGRGIEPELMPRIFDPFFTTKAVGKGTGLGLAIARAIIASHNGMIDVESASGQGTRFAVYLPLHLADPPRPDVIEGPPPRGNGESVLVVDDDPALVEMVQELLAELGYEPQAFSSSRRALDAFSAAPGRFHAVITDEVMPELTGSEMCAKIRARGSNVPIVVVSAHGGSDFEARTAQAGATATMKKPYRRRELATILAAALSGTGRDIEASSDDLGA